jgi:ABC-type dipeptide/oligopeptide/nickel transport system permease subunit
MTPSTTYTEKRAADGTLLRSTWDRWVGSHRVRFYVSLGYMVLLTGLVVFSYLTGYDGQDYRGGERFLAPRLSEPVHLFGTDDAGRDIFIRTIVSSKVIFLPGLLAISLSVVLGTLLAIASGGIWRGRLARSLGFFSRSLLDVFESFPKYVSLLLLITIISKPDFYDIAIALGVLSSSRMGKLVLAQIEALKERDFVRSSEALGISKISLVLRHILFYNCIGLYINQAASMMAEVVLVEIALSYFGSISDYGRGITVEPPMPSWGSLLVHGSNHFKEHFWISLFPALMVVLSILVFYMLADSAYQLFSERSTDD